MAVYDCDAFTLKRNAPEAVVLPQSTEQVAAVVNICNHYSVAIVPRGAGTSLAGGCLPVGRSVVLLLTRMNRVLEVNLRDRWAVVEAGVYNSQLTKALAGAKCFFASEPSTQGSSSIGGNVATNASGANTLKYGVTVNQVLGLEAVLGDGSIVQLGPIDDPASLDLIGLLVGSEGTLAIVTKVWLRLTSNPQDYRTMRVIFSSVDDAVSTVTQILGAGIIPSAIELLDQGILAAVNGSFEIDLPSDAGAALVIEIDGPTAKLDRQQEQIVTLCKKNNAQDVRQASSAEDRETLWKCRKSAITAAGDCPNFHGDCPDFRPGENGTAPVRHNREATVPFHSSYLIEDCVVPRTRLPQMLQKIAEIGRKHELNIMNVAHAADGNVHPIILFDERDQASVDRALAASSELLDACIALGGSVTAEHGIGARKVDFMLRQFQSADLEAFQRVRYSFDPYGLFNPGKDLPTGNGEEKIIHHGAAEATEIR
jgi:glycolate oxidase